MKRYYQLVVGGPRRKITVPEAEKILQQFKDVAKAANDSDDDDISAVANRVDLHGVSWPLDSIKVLLPFFEEIAEHVTVLCMADIIAGLETEVGRQVMIHIANAFKKSPLVEIDLSDNAMGGDLERVQVILTRPTLQRLFFNNCGLSKENMESLFSILGTEGSGRLRELELDRNMIGPEGAQHVGTLLAECTELRKFSYCGTRPGPEGTAAIAKGLKAMTEKQSNNSSLTTLLLEDCTFGAGEDEEEDAIFPLCDALKKCPRLQTLNLRDGELEEGGIKLLLESFNVSKPSLRFLDLACCAIGPDGALKLQELLLDHCTTLEILKLDTNELESAGVCSIISPFVGRNCCLKELNLEMNDFDDIGANAILSNSETLGQLKSLNLLENEDITETVINKLRSTFGKDVIVVDSETYPIDDVDDLEKDISKMKI